jgi:S1-C subfamily serine protease
VVYILSQGVGSGSGIIYDTNGDIVTNDHVVDGATKLTVTLNNGNSYDATIVGTDTSDDLAVIRIHASGLTAAHFASAGSYSVAQTVLAIGSPLGLKQSVTSGLISGLHRVEQEPNGTYLSDAIQTSAAINPGNSGGALVTLSGTVVGIPTLEQTSSTDGTSTQDIGFAIPSERVVLIANQLIANGKVTHTGRPYLGISPTDASSATSRPFGGTSVTSGALVSGLSSGGPAAKAGVQVGDVITEINGAAVTDAQDLLIVLAAEKPGDTVTLGLDRNGSSLSIQVQLGELPG